MPLGVQVIHPHLVLPMYGDGMKLSLLIAEAIGVVTACVGVFMVNVPLGLIASGLAVVAMIEANA